jgi:hypothetical protein
MTLHDDLGRALLAERYGTNPEWMFVEAQDVELWTLCEQLAHWRDLADALSEEGTDGR